jgi:hypothetical protein
VEDVDAQPHYTDPNLTRDLWELTDEEFVDKFLRYDDGQFLDDGTWMRVSRCESTFTEQLKGAMKSSGLLKTLESQSSYELTCCGQTFSALELETYGVSVSDLEERHDCARPGKLAYDHVIKILGPDRGHAALNEAWDGCDMKTFVIREGYSYGFSPECWTQARADFHCHGPVDFFDGEQAYNKIVEILRSNQRFEDIFNQITPEEWDLARRHYASE